VKVPNIGPAQAIYYDVAALNDCVKYIKENKIENPIVYILACRIGPFMAHFVRKIHKLGGVCYVNPDGHEWLRAKWSAPVRGYWKFSERMMVKQADLLVCDSQSIQSYIRATYADCHPRTTFIAYGAETRQSMLTDDDPKLLAWYREKGLQPGQYYLAVGRFVPENNYETMIREFMASSSRKKFALITNVTPGFLEELKEKTGFHHDDRICFVGTVYDKELLMKLRRNACGYLHGHEVGGTNPSLLEAMSSTRLNLLLDVSFNREVAQEAALYWSKEEGSLAKCIDQAERMSLADMEALEQKAKNRIKTAYSWQFICGEYARLFTGEK
jgi:rhamnosyltransferase